MEGERDWPWIARFALDLGSHSREAVEAALAAQAEAPQQPLNDFLEFDAEAHDGLLARLKDRPAELVHEVEGRAFLRWAVEEGVLDAKATQRALELAREAPHHRLWDLLREEGALGGTELPAFGSKPFLCDACRIKLDVPARLVAFIERCPACGVRRPRLSLPPPPRNGDPAGPGDWLVEETFARWAVTRLGIAPESVEEARGTEGPLWDALVFTEDLKLEQAMDVMGCEIDVACQGCGASYRLGAELTDFLEEVGCPRCRGDLEARASGTRLAVEDRQQTSISRKVDGFHLLHRLGGGQSGDVYTGSDEQGNAVAVKLAAGILQGDDLRRFEREGEVLEKLEHPNIVRVLAHGIDPSTERPYLAMELVAGRNLSSLLRDRPSGRLTPEEGALVLDRCARALAHAHERGVIHRDVKPSNVLIGLEGDVKLSDFGISLSSTVSRRLTRQGEVVGTSHFLAPETLSAQEADWGPAADLYALGATAFTILSGRHVFARGTQVAVMVAHSREEPVRLSTVVEGIPAVLDDLTADLLAKDPAARPSPEEVCQRLAGLVPDVREMAVLWAEAARGHVEEQALASAQGEAFLSHGQVFQHYRIERRIGGGGMGVVYEAYHRGLKRTVALKVLLASRLGSEDARGRFLREAEAASAVQHPYVVPVLDAGEHEGVYFITMEHVQGVPLHLWVQDGEVRLEEKLGVLIKVCEGVHQAHSRGVIHRDLKPENVVVDPDQDPHILDFGIAKRLDPESEDTVEAITTEGDILGTLRYMPPEQAAGRNDQVDVRSDVYALGAMLYLLACGRTPFVGSTREVLHQIHFTEPAPPSAHDADVPWELDAICLKALERDRDDRYQSALELKQDLERYRSGLPIRARQADLSYRLKKWVLRHRLEAGAAAAVLTTALLIGGAWALQARSDRTERRAGIVANVVAGWRAVARRDFARASLQFSSARDDWRTNDDLYVPRLTAQLVPSEVLLSLPPTERERPQITYGRLRRWVDYAKERIRLEQANQSLREASLALSADRLVDAKEAIQSARRVLTNKDPEVQRIGARITKAFLELGHAALQASRKQPDITRRREELDRAREAFESARRIDPIGEQILAAIAEAHVEMGKLVELEQAQVARRASLTRARALVQQASKLHGASRAAFTRGELPTQVRKSYYTAIEKLRRAISLVPEHDVAREARALLQVVASEFSTVLVDQGYPDLAEFILLIGGVDPKQKKPARLPQDPHLIVVESSRVNIRRAFGGVVQFFPTRAFDPLREYVRSQGKHLRIVIEVRSRITWRGRHASLFSTGLQVRLEDRKHRTVTPPQKIVFEGGPFQRPVSVDARGARYVQPFDRSQRLDARKYVRITEKVAQRLITKRVR